MKTSFFGYYPPTDAEYERLWREGLVVLDTNVLLNLYRLPTTARDELLAVLDLLKDRLWIPHQVALEFQRRRLTVIAAERKSTEAALQTASDLVADLKHKVDGLQIDKRGIGVDSQPLLENLEQANSKLIEAITSVHKSQLDISSSDPVRERLDILLKGRIGEGPSSQANLDELVVQGEERFRDKIPPGFADADKDKNPNEATFIHDQIRYQRKFGDLILWRQLIEHVRSSGSKCVLLVTADRKDDWWWREQGKTIGPHPELVREIVKQGQVDLYWMYSSVQFVEHANKFLAATVSSESVDELKHVSLSPQPSAVLRRERQFPEWRVRHTHEMPVIYPALDRTAERFLDYAVVNWLRMSGWEAEASRNGFPDIIAIDGEDVHGFDVKYVRSFDRISTSASVANSFLRGYLETREGRLSKFTLVLVIPESDYCEMRSPEGASELSQLIARLRHRYPIDGIVVGAVVGDQFEALIHQRSTGPEPR